MYCSHYQRSKVQFVCEKELETRSSTMPVKFAEYFWVCLMDSRSFLNMLEVWITNTHIQISLDHLSSSKTKTSGFSGSHWFFGENDLNLNLLPFVFKLALQVAYCYSRCKETILHNCQGEVRKGYHARWSLFDFE